MWDPHVILSDDEDDPLLTPIRFYSQPKKPRTGPEPEPEPDPNPIIASPSVVLIDDDGEDEPTSRNPGSTSATSIPAEHKLSGTVENSSRLYVCKNARVNQDSVKKKSDSGIDRFIDLESDNESEDGSKGLSQSTFFGHHDARHMPEGITFNRTSLEDGDDDDDILQVNNSHGTENENYEESEKKNNASDKMKRKKVTEEEKIRLKEEKKSKQLQEKLRKQALKAKAAELRKAEKEKKKWESGKNALKSIVAEIDRKVIEMGSIGGNLLTRFSEKGINFRITSNPIERSVLWTMKFPDHIHELSSDGVEIRYVLLVFEAEEFCDLVTNESLFDHVLNVQSRFPTHIVCYLTNRLMSYVNKREQEKYKKPTNNNSWQRPPVEEVLAKLTTKFNKVHSRQCIDEAELAEHVAGLTLSLASCQFRKKLTRLSVNANGSAIPKDSVDKNLIKNNLWLRVLVAIPKVQPRFAVAIWKKYPTMKSLMRAYMDPTKSVHEKEFLLKDLNIEGLLGEDRRLGEVCSKRMYRILMAKSGSIKTDDVEDGADFFSCQS